MSAGGGGRPRERLSWPRTIGIGAQHVVAMFGATFLVPLITGFPPSTTLFFSAIGTVLFLLITRNRVPSYLGSQLRVPRPDRRRAPTGRRAVGARRILITGALLALIGLVVHFAGARWIDVVMPPIVTGTVVALIGFNLAPAAWYNVKQAPATALVTIAVVVLVTVLFRGHPRPPGDPRRRPRRLRRGDRARRGRLRRRSARPPWVGLPEFTAPHLRASSALGLFLPVVLVLIAENVGHVKSVGRDDRGEPRRRHRPRAVRRRPRHHAGRRRRRLGHHDLRGEHRRHGRDPRLLHRRVRRRRCRRAPARASPRSSASSSPPSRRACSAVRRPCSTG